MALGDEYVGPVIMEVDGTDVDLVSLTEDVTTGVTPVETMNRDGVVQGVTRGNKKYQLRVTVAVPINSTIDWESVAGAKITIQPLASGGKRETYRNCYVLTAGRQYQVQGEARRDLTMFASSKVEE